MDATNHKQKPSGVTPLFPTVLHTMLSQAENNGYSNVVAWRSDGKSFAIYDRRKFVKDVLPLYFKQSKFSSFRRQLNLYRFQCIDESRPDYSGYCHELFQRDHPALLRSMTRSTPKSPPHHNESPLKQQGPKLQTFTGNQSTLQDTSLCSNVRLYDPIQSGKWVSSPAASADQVDSPQVHVAPSDQTHIPTTVSLVPPCSSSNDATQESQQDIFAPQPPDPPSPLALEQSQRLARQHGGPVAQIQAEVEQVLQSTDEFLRRLEKDKVTNPTTEVDILEPSTTPTVGTFDGGHSTGTLEQVDGVDQLDFDSVQSLDNIFDLD